MSGQGGVTDWNIDDWLGALGLDQYVEVFVDNGYDIPRLVASLSEVDLDVMHVYDREHREQLLKEAASVPADKPPPKPKRRRPPSVLRKMEAPDIEGSAEGLTRLQLKLKVGSELKNDKVEITALPYITEDGQPDTVSLVNLSKRYAAQFEVKVDDVYNTILDIWRVRRDAEAGASKSVFSQEQQPASPIASPSSIGPTETYDEIFDLSSDKKPVRVRRKLSGEHSTGVPMATSPNSSALVSDIPPKKSVALFGVEEGSPQASEVPEQCKQPALDDPMQKTNAIRTASNCSSSGSQKTASGGQSTDSDSSSPSGSPKITRKKRVWERNGKSKETYTALRSNGRSVEDLSNKKDKKRKHRFFRRMKWKLFSKSSTRSTESPESDKPEEDDASNLTRATSLPALAIENAGESFENYSQPFDSIAQGNCSPSSEVERRGPPIPVMFTTSKSSCTLPSGFSPVQIRKSTTVDDNLLERAQRNGNFNCCLDQPLPRSLPDSTHFSDQLSLEPVLESAPDVPPRNYTPPASDDEEVVVPPRQSDYLVTVDNSKKVNLPSTARSVEPPRTKHKGSSPVLMQQKMANDITPLSQSLPPLSTSSVPPPKPARKKRASEGLSSPQQLAGTSPARQVSPKGAAWADVPKKLATPRRRTPPKPPVVSSSTSGSPTPLQIQIVHTSPAHMQADEDGHHNSGYPSPSLPVTQPAPKTPEPAVPPKPPRTVPLSASADGIASSTRVCYKGDYPASPQCTGSPVVLQRTYSPSLPPKPRLRGMTQPSTSSKPPLSLAVESSTFQTSKNVSSTSVPPVPPKSPHLRSLSPRLPRPRSADGIAAQDSSATSSSASLTVPRSSRTPPPVRARGVSTHTPPQRAADGTSPMNSGGKSLVTRPSIPPKPVLRFRTSPPDVQRSAVISAVEAKLREDNISIDKEPYSAADGHCGIPPLLVSRYAKEIGESQESIGEALDFVRLRRLQQLGRIAVATSVVYWQPDWSVDSTSVKSWLTSIGLPMYSDSFTEAGFTRVDDLQWLTTDHDRYKQLQLHDPLHKDYITEGLKRLRKQRDS